MTRSVDDYKLGSKFLKKLTIILLVSSVILSLPALCDSHGMGENPSFKYSRQANENFDPKQEVNQHRHHHHHHHHGHDHDSDHDNHDHGHHHEFDHDHDHDHDHDRDHYEHDSHGHAHYPYHDDNDDQDDLMAAEPRYEGLVPDNVDGHHHFRVLHSDHDDHYDHHHHHHHHDHDHDHDHDHHHNDDHGHHEHKHKHKHSKPELDMRSVWLHSIGSTLLISAAPFLLLYVIPLDNSDAMKPRLKVLLAFASGGLLGDAFLHLIPHATHPHSHDGHDHHGHDHGDHHDESVFIHQIDDPAEHHSHSHKHDHHSHGHDMTIGLWVLGGIIAFLSVEKIVRILKGSSGHGHGHSHGPAKPPKAKSATKAKKTEESGKTDKKPKKKEQKQSATDSADDETNKKKTKEEADDKNEVEISGYLNLAADFAHNFTDGLAIGASYLAGNSIGIVTTITILLHEVPHEIGDFAILIKSGCSRRKAMLLQLVTALGAIAGTALALLGVSGEADSAPWVLPFTAGGFIYIATVSVLPELLEESTKFVQSIKEIVALLTGVGLMVIIANFE